MRRTSIALSVVLAFALVQTAHAAKVAPPGNSGVNQYSETLPGAGGDQPSGGGSKGQGGNNNDGGSSLSPAAERALEAQGPVGSEVAGLASETAPQRPSRQSAGADRAGDSAESGGSGFRNAVDQVVGGDSDGMGIALPIILVFSLLAALLLFALRRRGGEQAQ